MKLEEAKETTVFTIENNEIVEVNLYDKMCKSLDETTTPRGVGGRLFVEEESYTIDPNDYDDQEDLESEFTSIEGADGRSSKEDFELLPDGTYELKYYVISSWGCTGNKYSRGGGWDRTFLTEEAVNERMFEYLKVDFDADWDNSCGVYYDRDEAIQTLSEQMNIDVDVCEHILRKKEIVADIRKERKLQAQKRYEKEKEERLSRWRDKFGISKTGNSYDDAEKWFEQNKDAVINFIEVGGNEFKNMSSKTSKRVAYAICNNKYFDAEGVCITSLSHVIR